jgi:gamma-glutamyltranspeptidase/glutathione hydrolase
MTPPIVLKDDVVDAVSGSPGGSTIITTVAQTLFNRYLFGMSAQEAVSATRFHHQLFPRDQVRLSDSLRLSVMSELEAMGYTLEKTWLGDAQMVVKEGDRYMGGSDSRGRGVSLSF